MIIKNLKEQLDIYNKKISKDIYYFFMKEFNMYLEKVKLGKEFLDHKTLLTEAFLNFYILNFMNTFITKIADKKNSLILENYLYKANQKIKEYSIKNIVIITASSVSKTDEKFMNFITDLNETFKIAIKVRNINWYYTDFFKNNTEHYESVFDLQADLTKNFSYFDLNLFKEVAHKDIKKQDINFKSLWDDYFSRIILNSFARLDTSLINHIKNKYENIYQKIISSLNKETLVVFYNNVDIKKYYKTSFLNDLIVLNKLLDLDIPVITVGKYNELSLVELISQKNFFLLEDIKSIFSKDNKNVIENIKKPTMSTNSRTLSLGKNINREATEEFILKEKTKEVKVKNKENTITHTLKKEDVDNKPKSKKKTTTINKTQKNVLNIFLDEVLDEDTNEINTSEKKVKTKTIEEKNNTKDTYYDRIVSNLKKDEQEIDIEDYKKTIDDISKTLEEDDLIETKNYDEDFEVFKKDETTKENDNSDTEIDLNLLFIDEKKQVKKTTPQKKTKKENNIRSSITQTQTLDFNSIFNVNDNNEDKQNNENEVYSDILLSMLNNMSKSEITDYIKKISLYENNFIEYNELFLNNVKYINLTSREIDKEKRYKFRNEIFAKSLDSLNGYIIKRMESFKTELNSRNLTLQRLMNYYSIYLKLKISINEIQFLKSLK